MVLYIDLVIGSTLLVNYSLLKTIKLIFHESKNTRKMVGALLLSVLSLGFFFISNPLILTLRYLFGIAISLVAFDLKNKKAALIKTVIFYLVNFAFIGTLVIFKIYNSWLMLLALLYVIILVIIDSYKKIVINRNQLVYNVNIKGQHNSLRGFLDTGNQSTFEGIPIVFIDYKFFNDSFKYQTKAKVITIDGEQVVDLYQGECIQIDNKQFLVYYVFIKLDEYDLLLNLLIF
ncbi:MAG: sigma-E processing peptidase SpoIIGA [Bacilli bacterium]|jgi:hypothetical protein|nr:hypothetical protein [Acholeplasmataceae bacterium]